MINWFCRQTIRFNLLVMLLVLSIIPLIIAITQNYFVQRANLVEMASIRLKGVTLGHSKLVSQWFNDKLDIVGMFSKEPILSTNDRYKIKEFLLNVIENNPEFKIFIYFDLDGKIIAQTSRRADLSFSDRYYFKEALTGKAVISEVFNNKIFNEPCVVFSWPVKRNGEMTGVLAGSVALDELQKIVDVSYEGTTFKSYLAGDSGYYLVPPISNSKVTNNKLIPVDNNLISFFKNNDSQGVFHLEENSRKKMVAYRRIPEAHATLVIQQDESEAIESAEGPGLRNSIYITFVLMFLVVALAFWLSNKLSRPLEQISSSIRKIAKGDFGQTVVVPFANQEIRVISEDINLMSEQLWTFQATIEHQMLEMEEQKREITIRNQELLDSQRIIQEQMQELEQNKSRLLAQNNDLLTAKKQLTENNRLLENIANTDQLTGIYNRRFFTAKLYQEIAATIQNGQDLCIALLDIDHFKNINDTYGHKVGDQVLKELVRVIIRTVRDADVVARFGGEEFIILAPNTRIDGGQVMSEKIRSIVENHMFKTDAGILQVTVSIGVAFLSGCSLTQSIEQIEDCLFKAADKNLYMAKDLGRNRVVGLIASSKMASKVL